MEPDEFRRRSLASAAAAAAYVRTVFQMLPNDPDQSTWRRFIEVIYPTVMRGRLEAFELAKDYYRSQQPPGAAPVEMIERRYPRERLQKALEPARARLIGLDEFEANERRIAADAAEGISAEHVMAAGREGVEDAVKNDPQALGWARVPSGDETCAFCLLLVSRGPSYKSARSAGFRADGEPYHPNCDCVPVPVFSRSDWPGKDRYEAALTLYKDVTAGYSGRDALNALRRHLYASDAS